MEDSKQVIAKLERGEIILSLPPRGECSPNSSRGSCHGMPRLGDTAPEFHARSTQGEINFPSDYTGKWKILFSHPADFTPVCTSEFMMFGKMAAEFSALNCQLVGLSIDGLYSHIAWLRTIKEHINYRGMKGIEILFPVVEDVGMKVAALYGMVQPGESTTQAVRAVFFIDPVDKVRTIMYYPLALGRNFDEIKRVLVGLQVVDRFGVAVPANWRPGDEIILPTANSCGLAKERMSASKVEPGSYSELDFQSEPNETATHCYDWFFCTRPLPKDKIAKELGPESVK